MRNFTKKKYKGLSWDKIFWGWFAAVIALETNLVSRSVDVPVWGLKAVAMLTICVLYASMVKKVFEINDDVRKEKRKIISTNAENALAKMRKVSWIPLVPLVLFACTKENTKNLFWFLISVLLLLLIKFLFDDIVTFTENGYSSGFDEIEITSDNRVELKDMESIFGVSEVVKVEIYKNGVCVGRDILAKDDGVYLEKYMRRIGFEKKMQKEET